EGKWPERLAETFPDDGVRMEDYGFFYTQAGTPVPTTFLKTIANNTDQFPLLSEEGWPAKAGRGGATNNIKAF
ncbi:MAG: hypothetical protein ACOCZW_02745, partial [Bacteroidota bacterium]